ncbi:MAG: hypothetical protein ACOY94_05025 [Bacillota bacterium]
MFIGGVLIRRFDGFRRLCRHAAEEFRLDLRMDEEDLLLANRVLAALGGPPAAAEVRGSFRGDGLALLLLFLLTQENPCRVGLIGQSEPVLGRVKALTHLLGHAVWPVVSGAKEPLGFQDVVKEIGPGGAQLRLLFRYDDQGEPIAVERTGAVASLRTGADGGPYTLAVLLGAQTGPVPLAPPASLHPAVLVVTP